MRALLRLRGGGDSGSESSWGDPAPMVLMGTPVHYSSSSGGGDMRTNSIVLEVPYSHRHVAMALGAIVGPLQTGVVGSERATLELCSQSASAPAAPTPPRLLAGTLRSELSCPPHQ